MHAFEHGLTVLVWSFASISLSSGHRARSDAHTSARREPSTGASVCFARSLSLKLSTRQSRVEGLPCWEHEPLLSTEREGEERGERGRERSAWSTGQDMMGQDRTTASELEHT